MVVSCAAYNCQARFVKSSGIPFHSFPKDPEMRKMWILATRRKDLNITCGTRLCGKHFKPDDYVIGAGLEVKKSLKKNAIPSVFDFPVHLQRKISKRRRLVRNDVIENSPNKNSSTSIIDNANNVDLNASASTSNSTNDFKGNIKKNKYRYPGDFSLKDMDNPIKARLCYKIMKKQIQKHAHCLKSVKSKNLRLQRKITTMKKLVDHLQASGRISTNCFSYLKDNLSNTQSQLLLRQLKGNTENKFPAELRAFALTLHFYSNSAYNYVRKTFNNCLPHPSTLRKWYSTVDGSAGYTGEALRALKIKVQEYKTAGKQLICALIMDEMSIRQKLDLIGDRYVGQINFGTGINNDNLPLAKEAIVFLLVGVNARWKVPIGYFLTAGLDATEKANLVKGCLFMVEDTGARICSVTFDGAYTNFAMARHLGASFDLDNLQPWFMHPTQNYKIYLILDPCHMLKLVRNTLGDLKILYSDFGEIKWDYFSQLVNLQNKMRLHVGTKIGNRHLNYHTEKMKVRLAVQTLSNSVADAFDYCREDLNLAEFRNSQATSIFCRYFDRIFDIFNSRNFLAKNIYRRPMTTENYEFFLRQFEETKNFILSLRNMDGRTILNSNRKTGFLGILICIESFKGIFEDLLKKGDGMKFLLTYKLSQDHIEMFFCAIRARGGFNNNPSAAHFESAYKRLLIHTEVKSLESANCLAQDDTSILSVSASGVRKQSHHIDIFTDAGIDVGNADDMYIVDCNSDYIDDVVTYISGFVARSLIKKINCGICASVLISKECSSRLVNRKNRGGLTIPSNDVIMLCRSAEKSFRQFNKTARKTPAELIKLTVRQLNISGLFVTLNDHILDQDPLNNHLLQLIYNILGLYFNVRVHHHTRSVSEVKQHVRQKYSKLILFQHQ